MTDGIGRIGAGPAPSAGGTAAGPAASTAFETFLAREIGATLDTLHRAEEVAKRGVVGLAGAQEVVEAVTAAELALEKMVAVRDRVISAYQEIMRMPI